jgi:hypothetical protein
MPQYKMREELRNYFEEFKDRGEMDGSPVRSLYQGFNADRFKEPSKKDEHAFKLVMDEKKSLFDEEFADSQHRWQASRDPCTRSGQMSKPHY